jgi:hypothetical protein
MYGGLKGMADVLCSVLSLFRDAMEKTFSGQNYKAGKDEDFLTYKLHMLSPTHLRFFVENFGPLWDCKSRCAPPLFKPQG